MKNWTDSLTLALLAFSTGYLARDLAQKGAREDVKKALAAGKDKLRARMDALLKKDAQEDAVIEIEREDGSREVVDPEAVPVDGVCETDTDGDGVAPSCADMPDEVREYVQTLRETLESFHIRLRDRVEWSRNASVTRIGLCPEAGVSVRSVVNRMDDISLALAAPVRIALPLPGQGTLGFEIPNRNRTAVMLSDVWREEKYRTATAPLAVPLGVDVRGELRVFDLAYAPHMLVAGSTGTGKSVFIHSVLTSLMRRNTPDELRLLLIDPKKVEYLPFANTPHLLMPVITDCREACAALNCIVAEMERRYELMAQASVRNIGEYNRGIAENPDRQRLPYIVVAIDELSDLKLSFADNAVENAICRIAQKARAAGIHLLVSTRRPDVSVITGILKTNISTRIAFRVPQQADSRTILDTNGAECLIGRGDALFIISGEMGPVRMQCAFIGEDEVARVAAEMRESFDVRYDGRFMEAVRAEIAAQIKRESENDGMSDDLDVDENEESLFRDAVILAVKMQKITTSMLQRHLSIGYGRAARMIDRMEELGYVTSNEGGARPRKVLITMEQALSLPGAKPDGE